MSVQPTHEASLAGNFLVASPHAHRTPYRREIVLLLEHTEEGVLGIFFDEQLRRFLRRLDGELSGIGALDRQSATPSLEMQVRVARWSPAQLQKELAYGIWMSIPATAERLADSGSDGDLWVQLVRDIGRSILSESLKLRGFPANPSLN